MNLERILTNSSPSNVSFSINRSTILSIASLFLRTISYVSKNREAMDKIVDLLIEKETLDGDEFVSILSKFTKIPEKERTPQLLS